MKVKTTKTATQTNGVAKSMEFAPMPWHDEVRTLVKASEPPMVLLYGNPGVGKTTFARQLALEMTGQEPIVLGATPELEQGHILGRFQLAGNETRFCDGPLPLALKSNPVRYLLVEEFSLAPLEVRSIFLPLRDQRTFVNGIIHEELTIPSEFRLIATSNSEALMCRKNSGIAKALFGGMLCYEVPDLNNDQISNVIRHHHPKASPELVYRAVEIWDDFRSFSSKGSFGKSYVTPREALQWVRLRLLSMAECRANQIVYINKFQVNGDNELSSAATLRNTISIDESDSAKTA